MHLQPNANVKRLVRVGIFGQLLHEQFCTQIDIRLGLKDARHSVDTIQQAATGCVMSFVDIGELIDMLGFYLSVRGIQKVGWLTLTLELSGSPWWVKASLGEPRFGLTGDVIIIGVGLQTWTSTFTAGDLHRRWCSRLLHRRC